jgi:hypothetical protein
VRPCEDRSVVLSVRLTPAEAERLAARAERLSMTVSGCVRALLAVRGEWRLCDGSGPTGGSYGKVIARG